MSPDVWRAHSLVVDSGDAGPIVELGLIVAIRPGDRHRHEHLVRVLSCHPRRDRLRERLASDALHRATGQRVGEWWWRRQRTRLIDRRLGRGHDGRWYDGSRWCGLGVSAPDEDQSCHKRHEPDQWLPPLWRVFLLRDGGRPIRVPLRLSLGVWAGRRSRCVAKARPRGSVFGNVRRVSRGLRPAAKVSSTRSVGSLGMRRFDSWPW